jgi:YYY domain-containing protein
MLLLETAALAAYALLRVALPARPGVYALAKVAGVLAFAYLPWLTTSLGVTSFTRSTLAASMAALAAAGWLVSRSRRELWPARAEIVASEAVFWGAFALFLGMRLLNPEVFWGEKSMDFSFLNTLYRTETLPPPEPWFAGSPLMYTYFGHYVVAAIGKTLAIHPAVMYNLGIAVVAGLTAAALFAVGAIVGGGWHFGATAAAVTLLLGNLSGVRELLLRRAVNFDYFWATSRVIRDTINEYPFWSFAFADLHAHVLVMPWAVGFLALLTLWLGRRAEPTGARPRTATIALLLLCALMLGAITATNGWSMPAYFAVLVALLGADWLVHRARGGFVRVLRTGLGSVLLPAAAMIGGALLAFRPFWRHFSLPAHQWGREVGPYARPNDVLTVFGAFLVVLVPFFFATWKRVLTPAGERLSRGNRARMGAVGAALLLSLVDLRALAHLSLRPAVSVSTLAVALTLFALRLALDRRTAEHHRLPLLFSSFALALVAGCEFVFVWDRMNTVFKFYLEAWFLLGIASSIVLWELFRGEVARSRPRLVWQGLVGASLGVAAFTSLSGALGLVTHRHAEGPRFTLDGMAYLKRTDPQELAAFEWLNRNVRGLPVLAEAFGPSYGEYTRVCMNTGLPVVLGWDYHVFQRGHRREEIDRRKADLETIFTARNQESVAAMLARYHIALVYVGPLERRTYGGGNVTNFRKWQELVTPLYENPAVTIFAVNGNFVGAKPLFTSEAVPEAAAVVAAPAASAPPEATPQDPPGTFRQPRGLALDAKGNAYVVDFGNCRIQKLDRNLKPVAAWGRRGTGAGEFQDPCDVAVGPDGSVYVADTWNERIQVFDANGAPLRSWQEGFFGPRGIAVDGAGRVWVSDTGNNRLVRFSAHGAQELVVAPTDGPARLAAPQGIALDGQGRIYVCDNDNGRLQVFAADGTPERSFPVAGWRRAPYSEPHVALDRQGTIWVTVPLASEVRAYSADGAILRTVPISGTARKPAGIAMLPEGGGIVVTDMADGVFEWPGHHEN